MLILRTPVGPVMLSWTRLMNEEVGMKKTLLAIVFASFGLGQAQAKTDHGELHKELEIMTGILQTALKQTGDRRGLRFRSIDATYLANQGVLFEVNTSNAGWHFNFDLAEVLSEIPVAPAAPFPPVQISGDGGQWSIEIDEGDWESVAEDAMEQVREGMRELRDQLRSLREREREYAWEQREYERRKRDLEFEKRNADGERRKELDQRTKELEQELKVLEAKKAEVNKYAEQLEQEQKQKTEQRNAAKMKEYRNFLANFEANVGDVLCKYGAGIKALPAKENVTFLLPNLGSGGMSKAKQDKIYVFNHDDIQACVRDKIDTNKLLERAETYLF